MNNHQTLPLNSVLAYLIQNGWVKTSEIRGAFQIWHNEEFPDSEVTLPIYEHHKRYVGLLEEALEELSEHLHITIDTLKNQMYPNDFDAISVRAVGKDVESGSIPFDDGIKLLTSAHYLLKSCSSRVNKFKNSTKHINNFLSEISMGQTKVGSYIVSIESPLYRVSMDDEPQLFDNKVSIGRTINQLFHSKLLKVSKIIIDGKNINTITQKLLEIGLEKKECDALIDSFGNKSHRDVEFMINWSNKEPIEEKYNHSIYFYSKDVQKILEYREGLISKITETGIQLSGEIADLHRGYDDELGRAKLRTKYKNKDISVSFSVSNELYPDIAKAHVNKKVINITGELEAIKVGKRLSAHFKSFSNLSILDNLEIDFPATKVSYEQP